MRAFVRLRQMLLTHAELARKLEVLERKYDAHFKMVFEAIRQLMIPPKTPKCKIGFDLKEEQARYEGKTTRWRQEISMVSPDFHNWGGTRVDGVENLTEGWAKESRMQRK